MIALFPHQQRNSFKTELVTDRDVDAAKILEVAMGLRIRHVLQDRLRPELRFSVCVDERSSRGTCSLPFANDKWLDESETARQDKTTNFSRRTIAFST